MQINNEIARRGEKKKKAYVKPISFAFASIIILFLIGVYLLNNKNLKSTNEKNDKITILTASNSVLYAQNIIDAADQYIDENVDLENITDSLQIDAEEIINESELANELKQCSGKLILTKQGDLYNYSVESHCDNEKEDTYRVEFTIINNPDQNYDKIYGQVYRPVSNGYVGLGTTDTYEKRTNPDDENDLTVYWNSNGLIVKLDNNHNLEWVTKYDDNYNSNGKNSFSTIEFIEMFENEDGFVVFGRIDNITEGSRYYNGDGFLINFMLKLDKQGNIIKELKSSDDFIEGNIESIIYHDNTFHVSAVGRIYIIDAEGEILNVLFVEDGFNENGINSIIHYDGDYYFNNDYYIMKISSEGKIVMKAPVITESEYTYEISGYNLIYIGKAHFLNDKYYVWVKAVQNGKVADKLRIYDNQGKIIKDIDYSVITILNKKYWQNIEEINIVDNKLLILSDLVPNGEMENLALIDTMNNDLSYESRILYDHRMRDAFNPNSNLLSRALLYKMNYGNYYYYTGPDGLEKIGFAQYIVN